MAKIKSKPPKGTANRFDGRFDYTLPGSPTGPWSTGFFEASSGEVTADTDLLPTLADGTPYLPLTIDNYGSPGEGRNDDDDGFFYDVLEWEIEGSSSLGFEQDVYIFQEAAPSAPDVQAQVRLKPGSAIKAATILIRDYNSFPVQLGNDAAEQLIDSEGSGAIAAGGGNDVLIGLEGFDVLSGGGGNDFISGGSGIDILSGGAGDDELYGEDDLLNSFSGDTLNGGAGSDRLYGGSGRDNLYGGTEDDTLYGGSGADFLNGEAGSDALYGGVGDDTYGVNDLSDRLIEQVNEGEDTVQSSISYTLGTNLENLTLTGSSAIVGVGNELDNQIRDEDGSSTTPVNNIIDAGGGNDTVFARSGNDIVNGGDGNDVLNGGQDDDRLEGGGGNDRLLGEEGIDVLVGGEGNDTLYGGDGGGNDTLDGGNGNDTLEAGFGDDRLTGGAGADVFVALYSSNPFVPEGVDTLTDFRSSEGDRIRVYANQLGITVGDYSQFSYNGTTGALSFAGEQLMFLQPGTSFVRERDIVIVASRPIDPTEPFQQPDGGIPPAGKSVVGTAGNNRLLGDEGNDVISGLAGADSLYGQEGDDSLNGGDDADLLNGGAGGDRLQGSLGHDNLWGEAGDDAIEGGGGSDALTGGTGTDTLTGGTGTDRFNFYTPIGVDRITDFNIAEDKIGLYVGNKNVETAFRAAGFVANQPIAVSQFRMGAAAGGNSDRLIYDSSTGALFFDVDGTGAAAQVQIASLSTGLALNHTHIIAFDDTNLIAPPTRTSGTNRKDTLIGTSDDERLLGLGGNDTLNGGDGNDRLVGGKGSDRLIGGRGRDLFVLEKGVGRDVIRDFQNRQDRLGLSAGLKFNRLSITQHGHNTLISLGSDQLALLFNVRKNQITKADFTSAQML